MTAVWGAGRSPETEEKPGGDHQRPVPSVQQLYRISTIYWERCDSDTVAHEVHCCPLESIICSVLSCRPPTSASDRKQLGHGSVEQMAQCFGFPIRFLIEAFPLRAGVLCVDCAAISFSGHSDSAAKSWTVLYLLSGCPFVWCMLRAGLAHQCSNKFTHNVMPRFWSLSSTSAPPSAACKRCLYSHHCNDSSRSVTIGDSCVPCDCGGAGVNEAADG